MFFVDQPYVSDFLKATIKEYAIPVVGTEVAKEIGLLAGTTVMSEAQAVQVMKDTDAPRVYCSSENSIGWISEHLSFTEVPETIELFKNKLKFREFTQSIFPEFFFLGVSATELAQLDFESLPLPFIIKPVAGFCSLGVYKVSNHQEWVEVIGAIMAEIEEVKGLYPAEVLDTDSFIIEQCLDGEEFAFDAYYDAQGEPVLLGIYKHLFRSEYDMSDRVYMTSKGLIESCLEGFTDFTRKVGHLAGLKNFPVHIEVRKDANGVLSPIEVNPMRFGGWCTTADTTFLAYGLNPYLAYYEHQRPDWEAILKGKEGKVYSFIVLNNSSGIAPEKIIAFDYARLLSTFENPLEIRKVDVKKYGLFGILFAETKEENFEELERILHSDLTEFFIRN